MVSKNVCFRPAAALLPMLVKVNPVTLQQVKMWPDKLGPFALVDVDLDEIDIKIDHPALTYTVTEPELCQELKDQELPCSGKFSPVSPITIQGSARDDIGIPKEATHFCWAYGVGGGHFTEQQRAYFSTTHPPAAFLVLGGFLYLDDKSVVTAVKAISAGCDGLTFTEPQRWKHAYTKVLETRWTDITLPFLAEKGVKRFCWINPHEKLSVAGTKEVWEAGGEFGAFAYLFGDDLGTPHDMDRYFMVDVATGDASPSLGAVSRIVRRRRHRTKRSAKC
eukprot:SRR837773.17526.p1 GENE.SRR837773.17526~~SRR837773.17526.p1  ORF type:complete len:278 (+),score=28.77 SRR837773.17526:178-1011(+)